MHWSRATRVGFCDTRRLLVEMRQRPAACSNPTLTQARFFMDDFYRSIAGTGELRMLRSVSSRQYRIALYDNHGEVIEGAQYMHVSERAPNPGMPIDLPQGSWFIHEVAATWNEDKSSQLLGSDPHYGGTLVCRPYPPDSDPSLSPQATSPSAGPHDDVGPGIPGCDLRV